MPAPADPPSAPPAIVVVPSFHHDVAYLRPCREYLPDCFGILDEALRILDADPDYRFLVEQTFLLEAYWSERPAQRDALRRHARSGRLVVGPGMYVMPDMQHPDGESMFLQARIGKRWLQEHLGVDADVCWIADSWGHHAQLPQILVQSGYRFYVFMRCMRRDGHQRDFRWRGLDGTHLPTHWLAHGYAGLRFPTGAMAVNALELSFSGCRPAEVRALAERSLAIQRQDSVLVCNGGDMAFPQAAAPETVRLLAREAGLGGLRLGTPRDHLDAVAWDRMPVIGGELASAFQGSFTSNVWLKQGCRRLASRLLSLDAAAVALDRPAAPLDAWKLVLKQQFHDIICGTIGDAALADARAELAQAEALIDGAFAGGDASADRIEALFNRCEWPRVVTVERGDRRLRLELPAVGCASLADAETLPPPAGGALLWRFENRWYRAVFGPDGHLTSLQATGSDRELVRGGPCPFGALALQIDNGDLWLAFEGPLNGGSAESNLVQEDADPYERPGADGIVQRGTIRARKVSARILAADADGLVIEQRGHIGFWRIGLEFTTTIRLGRDSRRIEYETAFTPAGRHFRLRVAFPTAIAAGTRRDEIPFGIQPRGAGEHVCQHWCDWSDAAGGVALLNQGTPAANVCEGILMQTLFRSVAMEYKTESAASFGEGRRQAFRYALMPHGPDEDVAIIRNGREFNVPPEPLRVAAAQLGPSGYAVAPATVMLSALRPVDGGAFLRVHEATGVATTARIRVPGRWREWALADGLERQVSPYTPCAGTIGIDLGAFGIGGVLLRG